MLKSMILVPQTALADSKARCEEFKKTNVETFNATRISIEQTSAKTEALEQAIKGKEQVTNEKELVIYRNDQVIKERSRTFSSEGLARGRIFMLQSLIR